MPSSGANNTSPFVAGDVVFRPAGFTGTITNDWTTVPYCETDWGDNVDMTIDHLAAVHTAVNFAKGIGDICRYMGVVDGASWRMPTQSELDELYRNGLQNGGEARRIDNNSDWSPGLFAPLHGYAFGPHQTRVAITSNTQVENADPYTNGAVFLPASGRREYTDGSFYYLGSAGYCWSSTASALTDGYRMWFGSSYVRPHTH